MTLDVGDSFSLVEDLDHTSVRGHRDDYHFRLAQMEPSEPDWLLDELPRRYDVALLDLFQARQKNLGY